MQVHTQHYRQLLTAFVQQMKVLGYRGVHVSGVRQFLGWLEAQGVHDLDDLQAAHGKAYYLYLQQRPSRRGGVLSPHTINGYLDAIRLFLRWLQGSGQVEHNAFAELRFARPVLEQRTVMSRQQIALLYRTCQQPKERLLLGLFYGCGLRRSEGESLNLADVNQEAKLLYVRKGKGRKRRVIPLTERIVQDIQLYIEQQRWQQISWQTKGTHQNALALNRSGRRMRGESYHHLFRIMKERTGLPDLLLPNRSLHALRHSIATHLLEDGMPIERVRDFLGHDCLEATQIYTRIHIHQL